MTKSLCLVFTFITLSCASALAETPRPLGSYGQWSAWKSRENASQVCYTYTAAATMKPARLDHGRVGFSVRLLRKGKNRTEATVQAGYRFAPKALRVMVDGTPFTMVPRGQYAWLRREAREGEFVQALARGRKMTIEATSRRGNRTSYEFSLKGFTAAMRRARQACP